MGQIIGSTPTPDYSPDGQTNEVISVVPAQAYAVAYWDGEGKRSTCLVYHFGTFKDGSPGVFVFADQQEMQDTLRTPGPTLLKQIQSEILGRAEVSSEDVVAGEGDASIAASLGIGGE